MRARPVSKVAAALAVGLIGIAVTALGQQSSLEVRSPSAKLLDAAPGHIVTLSVVVANRGVEFDEVIESLTLPPGCQQVAPAQVPFRLPPLGQIVRLIAVAVPATMPAGRFPVRYTIRSRRDPSSIGSVDFAIQVAARDGLELLVEPQTAPILAGDSYPINLRVNNHGNSRISARLTHRSSLGLPIQAEAPEFALEAGASRVVVCRVKTNKAATEHTHHAVTFDVTATSGSGQTLTASQASVAEIIPLTSGHSDPYHHFPVQQRLTAFGASGEEGRVQLEFSGSGTLDEAGEHHLDFLLRGPNAVDNSLFGERDEYGASYQGAHWGVDVGDRVYELSPLTQRHSLGRGAGITWQGDNLTLGGFYMTTRYRRHNVREMALFARYDFTENFSLQGNLLRKTGGDPMLGQALPQTIVSLESHYRRGKLLDLETELAFSRSDSGLTDFAARIEAGGEVLGCDYSVEFIHAGQGFYGYYHNTDTIYSSLTRTLTDKLRVHASFNRYSGNLELNDVLSTVVNQESSWNLGATYQLSKPTEISIDWQHTQRQDVLLPAAYDFTEDTLRIGASHNFGKVRAQGALHAGVLDDVTTGENTAFQRLTGSLTWQPTARQSYSLYGSYGPSAFTGSTDKSLEAGVTADWHINDQIAATLSYALNQYDGLVGSEQNQALVSLRYQFKNKSSISLIGRWSRATTRAVGAAATNVSAVMVTYTMPFEIAIGRKRSIGGLRGRLRDVASLRGGGLSRVVLQVGDKLAVTDENGEFSFPELKPGPCTLSVREDSLGPRIALATPMPMQVRVRPAETTFVELEATPAASITVTATRVASAGARLISTSTAPAAGGQEGIVIEISNGHDVWRAQTDRLGAASFDRLPAGKWTLRAAATDLPAFHILEEPERSFTLSPGENEAVALRVLPQRRTVRMLESGTIR